MVVMVTTMVMMMHMVRCMLSLRVRNIGMRGIHRRGIGIIRVRIGMCSLGGIQLRMGIRMGARSRGHWHGGGSLGEGSSGCTRNGNGQQAGADTGIHCENSELVGNGGIGSTAKSVCAAFPTRIYP